VTAFERFQLNSV